jgi:micrococcal nuclease
MVTNIMNLFETLATLIAILLSWWSPASTPVESPTSAMAEVVAVIDGDTIIVTLNGQDETVRYIGIDTPEPRREGAPECGSREATLFNRSLVEGETVRLVADTEDRDRYDRLLRYVYVGEGETELFVNAELLRAGLASPLTIAPNDSFATEFVSIANAAKSAQLGTWSLCDV